MMTKSQPVLTNRLQRLSLGLAALALLLALAIPRADAGPKGAKGPGKGQFQKRYFEVSISDNFDSAFWPVSLDDNPIRIGRVEDGSNPRMLVNRIDCGDYADECQSAAIIPTELSPDVNEECFPGDDGESGVHVGTVVLLGDGTKFRMEFYARTTSGKTQYYSFEADSEPQDEWFGTFLDVAPGGTAQFQLTNWSLGPSAGPGGGKNACQHFGDLAANGRQVIVTVTRIDLP